MASKLDGFTLIEILVAIVIATIIVAIAVPAWTSAIAATNSSTARSSLTTTLIDSMRHATIADVEVVVCPVSGIGGRCTGNIDWSSGWIAFEDRDGNRQPGKDELFLRREPQLAGGVRIHSTPGRTRIIFQPRGSNAGSNATFTLCDRRGPRKATTLVLGNGSGVRSGTPTASAAQSCMHS